MREGEDRASLFPQLIDERHPQAILTRRHFTYRGKTEFNLRARYSWLIYGTLENGLPNDLAARLFTADGLSELQQIYPTIDIEHECCRSEVSGD